MSTTVIRRPSPSLDGADTAIATEGLTKRYGDLVAVDDLTLNIGHGEVFGLLGPKGAGKTTTILMLLGLTEPTAGRATVAGLDPRRDPLAVKARVGYMPDEVGFYERSADVLALREQECIGHGAADDQRIHLIEQVADQV